MRRGGHEIRERLRPSIDVEPIGDIAELQAIVWKAAVAGSVSAMRLYREILEWLDWLRRFEWPTG